MWKMQEHNPQKKSVQRKGFPAATLRAVPDKNAGARRGIRDDQSRLRNITR
jgi:hypothetical protein